MGHSTATIRNICIAGHAGSGKTTLVEALLRDAGVINSLGSVETQNTVSDHDDDERRLGHSLSPSICSFDHKGLHLNLIDTPGYPDFLGRTLSVLRAVETVAIVVDAAVGIETVTEQVMEAAKSSHLCRMIIVNGIDAAGADPARVLESLRETFGPECLPLNLPVDRAAAVKDCFFEPWSGDSDIGSFAEAHDRIVDQVVELDDELMELYLEQGEIVDAEQLHAPFERALREGHLVPVCFTSARENRGIDELLEVFERLMPNPDEGNPPEYLKGEGADAAPVTVSTDPQAHTLAHVFKMTVDPFRGRLGIRSHPPGFHPSGRAAVHRRRSEIVQGRAPAEDLRRRTAGSGRGRSRRHLCDPARRWILLRRPCCTIPTRKTTTTCAPSSYPSQFTALPSWR